MTLWGDARLRPLVVDPDAGRLPLIGSTWKRREPAGDVYDTVVIRGVWDLGPDGGGIEVVVSPDTFGPALTSDAESLAAAYVRAEGEDPLEKIEARLAELEARR